MRSEALVSDLVRVWVTWRWQEWQVCNTEDLPADGAVAEALQLAALISVELNCLEVSCQNELLNI